MNSEKILVSGDVCGNYRKLYARVDKIRSKKQDFDFLLCTGRFHSDSTEPWTEFQSKEKASIQTFILGPNVETDVHYYFQDSVTETQLPENICYLGKLGLYTSLNGVQIVYLSGIESKKKSPWTFYIDEIVKLCSLCKCDEQNFLGIDILLISQWPVGIPVGHEPTNPSKLVAVLIKKLKPRYVFCGTEGIYSAPSAFINQLPDGRRSLCRLITLSKVGSKEKWMYALELKTKEDSLLSPNDFTAYSNNPLDDLDISSLLTESSVNYRFSLPPPPSKRHKLGEKFNSKKHRECWFCLSSTDVEKHLIIHVGEKAYIALAKGGLSEYHYLITSISHYKCLSTVPEDITSEIFNFMSAVKQYFQSKELKTVFFERNFKSIHFQLNAVGVPERSVEFIEDLFKNYAESKNFTPLFKSKKEFSLPTDSENYFFSELPSERICYINIMDDFPLNFAREVLADKLVLNVPSNISWTNCIKSIEEESDLAKNARIDLKNFL